MIARKMAAALLAVALAACAFAFVACDDPDDAENESMSVRVVIAADETVAYIATADELPQDYVATDVFEALNLDYSLNGKWLVYVDELVPDGERDFLMVYTSVAAEGRTADETKDYHGRTLYYYDDLGIDELPLAPGCVIYVERGYY